MGERKFIALNVVAIPLLIIDDYKNNNKRRTTTTRKKEMGMEL
jgi:hypothetical protein